MAEDNVDNTVTDIQEKIRKNILPMLERHVVEKGESPNIRSFVILSIARLIRKLPVE